MLGQLIVVAWADIVTDIIQSKDLVSKDAQSSMPQHESFGPCQLVVVPTYGTSVSPACMIFHHTSTNKCRFL
jgi:hypothetical protein